MGLKDRPKSYHISEGPYFDASNRTEEGKVNFLKSFAPLGKRTSVYLFLGLTAIVLLILAFK
ncbi:TPA: hypothetical protein DCG61_00955 [Patescibacteria group bacterium]|jgi:hypothetical protein|nr:hypothetical protein [Patescibacteria group bacterium]